MHICDSLLGANLSELEQLHVNTYQECASQHSLMLVIKNNVENLELLIPPAEVWQKIAHSPVVNRKRIGRKWMYVAAIAASTSFISFTWLMFNNYQLQHQLEQVLQVNQGLELQLI